MAEQVKTFEEKLKEAAAKAREFTPDIDGTLFVATAPDGTQATIPLTMGFEEAKRFDNLDGSTEALFEFLEDFAGATVVEWLKSLKVELASAVVAKWAQSLHKFQGVELGE